MSEVSKKQKTKKPRTLTLNDLSKKDLIRYIVSGCLFSPDQGYIAACVLINLCQRARSLARAGKRFQAAAAAEKALEFKKTYASVLERRERQIRRLRSGPHKAVTKMRQG